MIKESYNLLVKTTVALVYIISETFIFQTILNLTPPIHPSDHPDASGKFKSLRVIEQS